MNKQTQQLLVKSKNVIHSLQMRSETENISLDFS